MVKNRRAADRSRVTERGVARQNAIFGFIVSYFGQHHRSPSLREIGDAVGIAPSTAGYHLENLEKAGRIHYDHTISRGITVLDEMPS